MSAAAGTETALHRHLLRLIAAGGPISVADYMALALNHPRYGYYTTRDPLGAAGDFITAPEISQIFGELIGLWCADLWQRLGEPDSFNLVELGPGRGTLMADALRAARTLPRFRAALHLHFVETSPALRQCQAAALVDLEPVWHADIGTLPPGPLLLIANEFLDALPIRQFVRTTDGWRERRIGQTAQGALDFVTEPIPSLLATSLPAAVQSAPPGSLFEVSPAALAIARTLGQRFATERGAALIIDYGHAASACGETLQAVRHHRPHPVLLEPGTADLTAHVDFAAFAEAAAAAGAAVQGPVTQAAFLKELGIEQRAERLRRTASPAQAAAIDSACRRLTHPTEMGTLFKVLALTSPGLQTPAGFASSGASAI